MEINFNELVQDALALQADHAAIAEVSKIKFVEEFRKACEQNTCRRYNTNWMCPPAVGPIGELIAKVRKYKQGLLFQTVHQLARSLDYKGMLAAGVEHEKRFRKIIANIENKYPSLDMLPLNAGPCLYCPRCGYLDNEKCRFPDKAISSVEAHGIDVMNLEKVCGIPYYNGKNTVSYVALILFM
ncbi:DUF2284 domain-containing protein [Sporomusa sp.]|uniref:DUF2284 domain-containing protein n=1 Tax=Sporomusa sp. TaxID=2078658 RepID=UPI002D0E23A7|nr:DUF2284 domain-containing protein [Sporomusa sp.]HWR05611.1 DUF2284 domain-containing protein [Sporomusa sp.]